MNIDDCLYAQELETVLWQLNQSNPLVYSLLTRFSHAPSQKHVFIYKNTLLQQLAYIDTYQSSFICAVDVVPGRPSISCCQAVKTLDGHATEAEARRATLVEGLSAHVAASATTTPSLIIVISEHDT